MRVARDGRRAAGIPLTVPGLSEAAYAWLRLGVAVLFVFHAPQKVFGWWGSEQFPLLSLRGFASAPTVSPQAIFSQAWGTA